MQKTNKNVATCQYNEEIAQLQDQVATLEELLLIYEQSATERENHLQEVLRKSEEKALQLEHAKSALETVEAILDSMGDAVIVIDSDGRTLFSNPAAANLIEAKLLDRPFSYQPSSFEQVSPHTKHSSGLEASSLRTAILGKSIDSLEMYLEAQSCWLSISARPLGVRQAAGAVTVCRDVTLDKQAAQALQQSNKEFRQQSQVLANTLQELKQTQAMLIHKEKMSSLGQTIAGIAHEINNPLSFIHGNIESTKQTFQELLSLIHLFEQTYPDSTPAILEAIELADLEFLSEDIPRMMTSMASGTERIREIVESLRVFSHLDEAAVKAVDIHAGIDSACMVVQARLRASADQGAITLRRNYGTLPLLECHASQMNQVFEHLLTNAVYALRSPKVKNSSPEIVICTEACEGKIFIRISDNGIGIPESIQPKIFDPFFTTKPVGQGTGLGLAVCHQIVADIHQGAITCTSKEGVGTKFEIALPCP